MIFDVVKGFIKNMIGANTVKGVFKATPAVSSIMTQKIDLWTRMYKGESPWLKEPTYADPTKIVSLGLPSLIASEKARMTLLELKSNITPPMGEDGRPLTSIVRAKYMDRIYNEKLLTKIRTQLEYGIAKGSLIIKPYITTTYDNHYDIDFDFIQSDCFFPFAYDSNGNLTEVAFVETKSVGDKVYTRLEYHKLDKNSILIENRAYVSDEDPTDNNVIGNVTLGKEVPLSTVTEWENITESGKIDNVDRLLIGYFKMPDANIVDPHSPLGISGFAKAEKLIEEADKQFSRLLWEYEGGELAIDIDRDALQLYQDTFGKTTSFPSLQKRLFRPVDLGESTTYEPYAPSLRDNSYIQGLNNLLMRIEDVCAISRGTLSDTNEQAKTATELKILKQRSYASIVEIQKALERALRDTIYAMDKYCSLYNIVGDIYKTTEGYTTTFMGGYEVSFDWDDSIIVDIDLELSKRLQLLQANIITKEELRQWYFGESEKQAKEAIKNVTDTLLQEQLLLSRQLQTLETS